MNAKNLAAYRASIVDSKSFSPLVRSLALDLLCGQLATGQSMPAKWSSAKIRRLNYRLECLRAVDPQRQLMFHREAMALNRKAAKKV